MVDEREYVLPFQWVAAGDDQFLDTGGGELFGHALGAAQRKRLGVEDVVTPHAYQGTPVVDSPIRLGKPARGGRFRFEKHRADSALHVSSALAQTRWKIAIGPQGVSQKVVGTL